MSTSKSFLTAILFLTAVFTPMNAEDLILSSQTVTMYGDHTYETVHLTSSIINVDTYNGYDDGRGYLRIYASSIILDNNSSICKGNLALTVSEGAVRKYIEVSQHVIQRYGVDDYTKQNMEWLTKSTDSLFSNDKVKQLSLDQFL